MALYFHITDEDFVEENQLKEIHGSIIEFVKDLYDRWVIPVLAVERFNGAFANTQFPIINLQPSDFPIGEDPLEN